MIVIPEFPECGFGNKALYYNNMRQLAHQLGVGFSCPEWEGCDVFDLEIHKETPTDQYAVQFIFVKPTFMHGCLNLSILVSVLDITKTLS